MRSSRQLSVSAVAILGLVVGLGLMPQSAAAGLGEDFGDAPDPIYPTLRASNGARHLLGGPLFLGSTVDSEPDGQPGASAVGDDLTDVDDEDGVVFVSQIAACESAFVDVTVSAPGLLSAWVDFNGDGDWADPGEQIFTDAALAPGLNPLAFSVPCSATPTNSFSRFRVSNSGGLSFDGAASDGEVEDHVLEIMEQSTSTNCPSPGEIISSLRDEIPSICSEADGDDRVCVAACRAQGSRCQRLVNSALSCGGTDASSAGRVGTTLCRAVDDRGERRECTQGEHESAQDNRPDREDRSDAREGCHEVLDECLERCPDDCVAVCETDADCADDSVFCNGFPSCGEGTCFDTGNPCGGSSPICVEETDECFPCSSDEDCPGGVCHGSGACF